MTGPLYFSRATLKRDPAIEALAPVLAPEDSGARLQTDHRLMWSLFAGDRNAQRDFLFRREDRGAPISRTRFLILSRRPPNPVSPLFDVETKDFAPALATGDRLGFSLLANPAVTHWREENGKKIRFRDDVVMHALSKIPKDERKDKMAAARRTAIETEGHAWLKAQAARAGFAVEHIDEADESKKTLKIDGYDQFDLKRRKKDVQDDIARGKKGKPISVSVLSFDGFLVVEYPEIFLQALSEGFGRARAFGCGLMLIRRA